MSAHNAESAMPAILRKHCEDRHHLPRYKPGWEIVVDARLGRWHQHEHATGVYEPHDLTDIGDRPGPAAANWPANVARPQA